MATSDINKCICEQTIKIIEIVFEKTQKEQMDMTEIKNQLNTIFLNGQQPIQESAKPKKPKQVKEIESNDRCIALKKDKTRCKSKKLKTGDNPEICSLHNKGGAKFGYFRQETEQEAEVVLEEPEMETCSHIFTKGNRKNEHCGNIKNNDSGVCDLHEQQYVYEQEMPEEYMDPIGETINNSELFGEDSDIDEEYK